MSLICETCYIWTALSPDIRHTVEAGTGAWGLLGHAPSKKDMLEGCGCACSLFWNHARPPILTAGSESGTKQGITFTFTAEEARSHSWPEASTS